MNIPKHIKEHAALGLPESFCIVDISPDTPQIMASPISGDPDIANEETIAGVQHIAIGFLLPKAGIITEIHMETQGNTGGGATQNVRYSVVKLKKDSTASTGLAQSETLLTGLTGVADNVNGDITLASGLSLAVPAQFVIAVKAPFGVTMNIQNTLSAGPIPGVVGNYLAGLISAATYAFETVDVNNPPNPVEAGDRLVVTSFKGLSIWIKWKGE